MQVIFISAIKQIALWLLSSTFRQIVKVVKRWVDEAEKMDGIDKKTFAMENIKKELKESGIEVIKGVAGEAMSGVKVVTPNVINELIEKYASQHP